MGDTYSLQQAIKKKKGQTLPKDAVQEAIKIEEQNFEVAKQTRIQLEQSAVKQKATTEQMKRQGEILKNAKRSAAGVNVNAERGSRLADDLEREGRFFSCKFPCIGFIKKWFCADRESEEMKNIMVNERDSSDTAHAVEEAVMDSDQEEIVPGQKNTDRELYGVLNAVRNIRAEADKQNREADRQKTDVEEISRMNKQSENVIKKTDEHIKRI